ncbi:hypothetical protein HBB16_20055 [Pseudonocardia sp. MCCB 268]|nr:hypothetical protein [Pseudonocardia cytotoxica]
MAGLGPHPSMTSHRRDRRPFPHSDPPGTIPGAGAGHRPPTSAVLGRGPQLAPGADGELRTAQLLSPRLAGPAVTGCSAGRHAGGKLHPCHFDGARGRPRPRPGRATGDLRDQLGNHRRRPVLLTATAGRVRCYTDAVPRACLPRRSGCASCATLGSVRNGARTVRW